MSQPALQIDIVSDFVCPWCWLGWKQFESAGVRGDATFRPFQLDPLVPREGRDYAEYMRAKFGGGEVPQRFRAMREHLEAAGPAFGITFRFDEMTRRPNTMNAHRLQRWATGQDLGTQCAQALFRAYFEELRDIGDTEVLCEVAGGIGMDADLVRELLGGDRDRAEVEREMGFFRNLGVSSVPTFIYAGQHALQGAQDPAAHRKLAGDIRKGRT